MKQRRLTWISFIVLLIGTVLHTVGLATPGWTVWPNSDMGPFTSCSDQFGCGETGTGQDKVDVVKAMTIIAMILAILACLAVVIMLTAAWNSIAALKVMGFCALGSSGISFCFVIIGAIIWSTTVHESVADLGYSFALSLIGGTLIVIGGTMACIVGRAS